MFGLRKKIGNQRIRYVKIFLTGFLAALALYFYLEDNYEKQLFRILAEQVMVDHTPAGDVSNNPSDSILVRSVNLVHYLGERRNKIFVNKEINSFKSSIIHPVTFDLMTTNGSCGSYSYVLGRLLTQMDIPVRFAQMKAKGQYGAHIVIEARQGGQWVVLDPTYDLTFRKPDGKLASFSEVGQNWKYFSQTLPPGYDTDYKYEGVRYTNWNKIPVIMPALRSVIGLFKGRKAAEETSLRTIFLRKYHILFILSTISLMLLVFSLLSPQFRLFRPKTWSSAFVFRRNDRNPVATT